MHLLSTEMSHSLRATVHRVYENQGVSAVIALGFKKIIGPIAKVGSLYFLERDLSLPMPPLPTTRTIVTRQGTLNDIHLLDNMPGAARHKLEAAERLKRGDHWFVAIDRASGKLTNHRWVSRTSCFIPELGREVVVKPEQAYLYDLETVPEFRRQGIEARTRQYAYEVLHRDYGVRRILVYIRADNFASLQAARNYLTPMCRVWFARIGNRSYMFAPEQSRMPELRASVRKPPQAALRARPSNSLR